MDRDLFSHLPVLIAVARRRGFAAAAAELGMTPSAVSHSVKLVEDRLGMPLFARTTRSVALTEAGESLLSAAGRAFSEVENAWDSTRSSEAGASGHLRINAPRNFADWLLRAIISAMQVDHPNVMVEIRFDDGLSDVVGDAFDAGIRLGDMVAQDMVAVRIAPPFRAIIAAAPAYIKAHGQPQSLADLATHNCIQYRMTTAGNVYRWDLQQEGRSVAVETRGNLIVNDMMQALVFARAGLGLCYSFEPVIAADLAAANLIEVLPQSAITEGGVFLYFPKRASMAPKLRAFIDTAKQLAAR
jgi:DNA-binding transcriptional LysR family regulator